MLRLKGFTTLTLTKEKLSKTLDYIDRILIENDVFKISKDKVKGALEVLTDQSVTSPTLFLHDILLKLNKHHKEPRIKNFLLRFGLAPSFFSNLIESENKPNWPRYFNLASTKTSLLNRSSFLVALHQSPIVLALLQDKIPADVSKFFNVKRLSTPQMSLIIRLIGIELVCGGNSSSDPHNIEAICKYVKGSDLESYFINQILITSTDIDSVIDSRETGAYPLAVDPKHKVEVSTLTEDDLSAFDVDKFFAFAIKHFKKHNAAFANILSSLNPNGNTKFSVNRWCDIINALFYIEDFRCRYPNDNVPIPAQRALGANIQPQTNPVKSYRMQTGRQVNANKAIEHHMPLYEQLVPNQKLILNLEVDNSFCELTEIYKKASEKQKNFILKMSQELVS